MNRSGMPWTPAEDDVVREMFAAGATDAEIGQRLGRTAAAIQMRRSQLGGMMRPVDGGRPAEHEIRCWSAWLPMRARMQSLEERDALRDQRDAERYEFTMTERGLSVREREAVAA